MKLINRLGVAMLFFIASNTIVQAQTSITPKEAKDHMGDSVQVCDRVLGGKYLLQAKDAPARLYIGSRQPNPMLTIVINADVRRLMKYDPEKKLVNKKVCVKGVITTYEGRPAIVLQRPEDIEDMQEK